MTQTWPNDREQQSSEQQRHQKVKIKKRGKEDKEREGR
jgi:hypothetical protein